MNNAFGLPQSVVVLGGTSDIAQALVEQLAATTAKTVVLAARHPERLEAAAQRAKAAGAAEVHTVKLQATDAGGAADTVAQCFDATGQVDLVVVAVGLLGEQLTDERRAERVAEVIGVNFTWPAAALAEVARRLGAQGQGRIMVLSSVAGVRVRRANYIYGSAKAGLDSYCVGLAESLRGTGVVVQVIRPGFVHSKMTAGMKAAPLATTPEVVAAGMMRALTTAEPVVWVPAKLRLVFGVFRQLPQALWRRLPG